jgi:hypothetical protein
MELVYVLLILWGVDSAVDVEVASEQKTTPQATEEIKPTFSFEKGDYYSSKFGYYISNLSDTKCIRKSLLIADLTKPVSDVLKVDEVKLGCTNA